MRRDSGSFGRGVLNWPKAIAVSATPANNANPMRSMRSFTRYCFPPLGFPGLFLGVTLVELMVSMAVLAVLLTLAAPSLQQWMWSRQVNALADTLLDTLRLARTQAARAGVSVTVCPLALPVVRPYTCADGARHHDWSVGWLVFFDRGLDGQVDAQDTVLRVEPAVARGRVESTTHRVSLQPLGVVEFPHAGFSFQVSPDAPVGDARAGAVTRRVCVSKPGRARLTPAGVQAC